MITVTGASGHLGRLVVADLLDRGVPADQIVAVVRSPEKVADLAARGVVVRAGDYDRPETLGAALAGTEKLLLISGSEVGKRIPQHRNVVDAAVAAGVSLIVYTSIARADTGTGPLVPEHRATEEHLRASGLPYVFLRNSWYVENYTEHLDTFFQFGAILGAAGEGRVSAAPRADFAAAAAAVLTGQGPADAVYELGGDTAFTMAELAAEVSRQSGREVVYTDLSEEDYAQALIGAGLPEPYARALAGSDVALRGGELLVDSGHLRQLIGRPTTPLADSVALALKG
jgi:NAD(P)H dehydrogenase (quinone)